MGAGAKRDLAAKSRETAGQQASTRDGKAKSRASTTSFTDVKIRPSTDGSLLESPESMLDEYHAGLVCVPILAMWTAGALFLSQMPSDANALAISDTRDPNIHVALTTATMVHGILQLINLASCNQPRVRKLVLIPLAIDILPMLFSIMHQYGVSPVYLDAQGRVFSPIRYLTWSCTTSMLLYLQWLTSESRIISSLLTTLAWDITMLLTGVWACFATSETAFYFAAGVSCYAEFLVLEQQRAIYRESIAVYRHLPHTAQALRNVYIFATVSWILFPVVWFLGQYGLISHNLEEALWCACDFGAKMCQSIALHQGVLSTVEDRNQQSMEAARDQMLQQIMLMKDREQAGTMHIANVSHELRTPLNGIIGLSEALITDHDLRGDDAEAIHCLKAIRDSGARLNMMVNNMLDNAELTHQELKLELGPVKLSDCLHEVTLLLAPMVSSKVTLKMDVPDTLPPMRGNRDRLVQVYFNLIGNSVKFCREGTINIVAYTRKKDMIVEVRDTGPGISQEQMKKLFTPFAHGGAPLEAKLGSTGLGLCLVEALVQTHGGTVKAVSEPNVLTVFTTTIPLYNPRERHSSKDDSPASLEPPERNEVIIRSPSMAEDQRRSLPRRGQVEILSVDDDPMNHLVLRNILKNSSYTVIEADCGEQALKFLADRYQVGKLEALPSMILMDVMMPGLNGFQTTEKIREMFPEALLPIIMISATASEDSICRGFRAGCNDYLSKPIKRKDLLARIKQKLGITHKVKQYLTQGEEELGEEDGSMMELQDLPAGKTAVENMTVVSMSITNLASLAESMTPEQLQSVLTVLFKKLHAIRQSCKFCTLCMMGDFLALGIGHQADGMAPDEQAQAALTLATLAMRATEAVAKDSGVGLLLGVAVHMSGMTLVPLLKRFVYMGAALRDAMSGQRFGGCICVSHSVREHAANWSLAEMAQREGVPPMWLVQDGTHWVTVQAQAREEASKATTSAGAATALVNGHGLRQLSVAAEEDVPPFLAAIGMAEYEEVLKTNRVSISTLAGTQEQELLALGVLALAHRQRLIAAAKYCCMIWGSMPGAAPT